MRLLSCCNPKVGDATIIVNRAVLDVNDPVRELYAQGDLKTIQELLRHATFKVTADTCTQAVTPVKRDAQARIAKLIKADGSEAKAITPTLQ